MVQGHTKEAGQREYRYKECSVPNDELGLFSGITVSKTVTRPGSLHGVQVPECIQDPHTGYRSQWRCLALLSDTQISSGIFSILEHSTSIRFLLCLLRMDLRMYLPLSFSSILHYSFTHIKIHVNFVGMVWVSGVYVLLCIHMEARAKY